MKPKAQPRPRQDSQQTRTHGPPAPKGDMANFASPRNGCTGSCPDAGKANTPTTSENAPCPRWRQPALRRDVEAPLGEAGRRVGEPSQQRTVSVEDGTLWHNLPQQAGA